MNWLKTFLILVILIGIVWLVHYSFSWDLVEIPASKPMDSDRLVLKSLDFEQRIGQRFVVGFQGTSVTPELREKIKRLHPAGVLLLDRNIENEEQLRKLNNELQEIALNDTGLPLLVAVDQEGGSLCRISWLECVSLSEIRDVDEAYRVGFKRGEELKKLGVNLNLAPVLDKSYLGDFIYPRTFQSENSGKLASSFISGQQKNILNALKHFPGYTTVDFDPEREKIPELESVPETLQFKTAMEVDPAMVMTANVIYDEINSDYPLGLTKKGINFTRSELNPDLIISDDLSSPALKERYGLEETVEKSFNSGTDLLIVAGFDEIEDVEEALGCLNKEEINFERLNQSLLRIISLKQDLNEEGS